MLYVSPLKALTYDVERNLRAPLAGIRRTAAAGRLELPEVRVASRTGDTPADARRQLAKDPPDILVTTPESLYLLLTSQAREALRGVQHVIVDEVHAIAGTKRGAHLALSLERLAALTAAPPQRIGLSATQRPLERIAAFLGGAGPDRSVEIVDAGERKELALEVIVPIDDMARIGETLDLDEVPGGPAAGPEARTLHLAEHPSAPARADPGASVDPGLRQLATPRRTTRRSAQRAGRGGAGARPPRQHRPRAAAADRGGAQGRPPAGPDRDQQPGARDRHGCDRPRRPDRGAAIGRIRPAADRAGRPPGGRAVDRQDLPEVPRRPGRGGGGGAPHARRGDRGDAHPAQPARRAGAADRGHGRHGSAGGSTTSTRW